MMPGVLSYSCKVICTHAHLGIELHNQLCEVSCRVVHLDTKCSRLFFAAASPPPAPRPSSSPPERGRGRQQLTRPYVKHIEWLRERGGTCSLPEVGGGGSPPPTFEPPAVAQGDIYLHSHLGNAQLLELDTYTIVHLVEKSVIQLYSQLYTCTHNCRGVQSSCTVRYKVQG